MATTADTKPFPIAPTAQALARAVVLACVVVIGALAAMPYLPWDQGRQREVMSLEQRLAALRGAADRYYHEHGHRYPGEYAADGKTRLGRGREAEAARAFIAQLTGHTDAAGVVGPRRSARFRYGPYLDAVPANPLSRGAAARRVDMNFTLSDPDAVYPPDGSTGWRYYARTGRLVANDDTALPDGTPTAYR